MSTWKSRGLRGSQLEEMINRTIDVYREKKLALIQKIPTPITPIDMDKSMHQITLAYFNQKSTVDYIGLVQTVPVCFDAKECASDSWALKNLHPHQVCFMREWEEQGGVSFIILSFTNLNEIYYIPFSDICHFLKRMEEGGRKSFTYNEVDKSFRIRSRNEMLVHFLEPLQMDLDRRSRGNS